MIEKKISRKRLPLILIVLFLLSLLFLSKVTTYESKISEVPSLKVKGPEEVLLNSEFSVVLTFLSYTSLSGYGPVILLELPEGLKIAKAALLEIPLRIEMFKDVDNDGSIYLRYSENFYKYVKIKLLEKGASLAKINLPFNHLSSPVDVKVWLRYTKPSKLLVLNLTPVFTLGKDPYDNPNIDPPILGRSVKHFVKITYLSLDLRSDLSSDKAVIGPNWPFRLIGTVNVAENVQLSNVTLEVTLPDPVQYVNFSLKGAKHVVLREPDMERPGGTLVLTFNSLRGTSDDKELEIELIAFVRDTNIQLKPKASSLTVLFRVNASVNKESLSKETSYKFTAVPYRVTETYILLEDKSPRGLSPYDVLEFEIRVDISDFTKTYISNITQILGDGLSIMGDYIPLLKVHQRGLENSLNLIPGKDFVISPRDEEGNIKVVFHVSQALARVSEKGGSLVGGLYDLAIREAYKYTPPYNFSDYGYGKTYVLIRFRVKINEIYFRSKLGSRYIVSNDKLSCKVILDLPAYKDSHSLALTMPGNEISIHSVKGNMLVPGEDVTLALRFRVPFGRSNRVSLSIILPRPILFVNYSKGMKPFANDTGSFFRGSAYPPPGYWNVGTYDTIFSKLGIVPKLTSYEEENKLVLYYGDLHADVSSELIGEVFLTLKVTDLPYFNPKAAVLVTLSYEDSNRQTIVNSKSLEFKVVRPILSMVKHRIEGEDYPDAGDNVRFRVEITNRGESPAYDVSIGLIFDRCLPGDTYSSICTMPYLANVSGLRVFFSNGTKVPIKYNLTYSRVIYERKTYITTGYVTIDIKPPINPAKSIIIEYNLTLGSDITPAQRMVDLAVISSYASIPGGNNLVDPQDPPLKSDIVLTKGLECEKKLLSSSSKETKGSHLTIGEEALMATVIKLPEGFISAGKLKIIEGIPHGLVYVIDSLNVEFKGMEPIAWRLEAPWEFTGSPSPGDKFTIVFEEDVRVPADNNPLNDPEIEITYRVRVANVKENYLLGDDYIKEVVGRTDAVIHRVYEPCSLQRLYIVRPQLMVSKTFEPSNVYPGQPVNVTITVSNIGTSPAFDTEIVDILDSAVFDLKSFKIIEKGSGIFVCKKNKLN